MKTINDIAFKKAKPYAVKSSLAGLHVKDVDLTGRVVTGFYNASNYFDSDQDVILPGAANKSIKNNGPTSDAVAKIKHLLFHDWKMLPGKLMTLEEKTVDVNGQNVTGIYFETAMAKTQMGTDTLINYQSGIYDNHSIGFQYLDGEFIDEEADNWDKVMSSLLNPEDVTDGYMFVWKEIRLWEGSTVAFGANSLTPYLGVKDNNPDGMLIQLQQRICNISDALKNGKQSDEMMQTFEMQLKQLGQMINEIFQSAPDLKSTLAKDRKLDTPPEAVEFNLQEALNSHPFFQ